MELTYVCELTDERLIPVSADELAKRYPDKSIIKSFDLICALCGEDVIFVSGEVQKPHFRHNRHNESKECPQLSVNTARYEAFQSGEYLPRIRIIFQSDRFSHFEIGLNREIIENRVTSDFRVEIRINEQNKNIYLPERFQTDGITYLDVGDLFIQKLAICIESGKWRRSQGWNLEYEVMNDSGAIFDGDTGHFINYHSDIVINKEYYLLVNHNSTQLKEDFINTIPGVYAFDEKSYCNIRIYKFRVKTINKDNMRAFLKLHYVLTDSPAKFLPIWPAYTQDDNIIQSDGNRLYYLLYGKFMKLTKNRRPVVITHEDKAYHFGCITHQPMPTTLTFGRISAMDYYYLFQNKLVVEPQLPKVIVCDAENNPIQEGVLSKLPLNKRLYVKSEYDFMVKLYRKHSLAWIQLFKSGIEATIPVTFRNKIEVYIGLDRVFALEFVHEFKQDAELDQIYQYVVKQQGKMVPIDYSFINLLKFIDKNSNLYRWLYKRCKLRYISQSAAQYIILKLRRSINGK